MTSRRKAPSNSAAEKPDVNAINAASTRSRRRRKLPTDNDNGNANDVGTDSSMATPIAVEADKENFNLNSYSMDDCSFMEESTPPRSRTSGKSSKPAPVSVSISVKSAKKPAKDSKETPTAIVSKDGTKKGIQKKFKHESNEIFAVSLENDNANISNPIPVQSTKLVETIANASSAFPNCASEGAILLEEKQTDIINIARRCIRSAAGTGISHDGDAKNQLQAGIKLSHLRTAIHCLRATIPMLIVSYDGGGHGEKVYRERMTMAIKLLYHCITTVEVIQKELFEARGDDVGHEELIFGASFICLYGYQMLGLLLSVSLDGFVVSPIDDSSMTDDCECIFPIPCFGTNGLMGSALNLTEMDLSVNQIVKIATQSVLSMCSVLNIVMKVIARETCIVGHHGLALMENNKLYRLFGDTVQRTLSLGRGDIDQGLPFVNAYRDLVGRIAVPWALVPLTIETCDSDQIQASLAFASKGSKLLLDAASFAETISSRTKDKSTIKCLQRQRLFLQQDSILVLLLRWKNIEGRWVSVDSPCESKLDLTMRKCFGKACVSAMRASTEYPLVDQNATALTSFHQVVGDAIDGVAYKYELLDVHYVEYCIYRAMHLAVDSDIAWRKKQACNSSKCILTSFPFPFRHRSRSCKEKNPAYAIVALFYMCLSAKHSIPLIGNDIDDMVVIDDAIETFRDQILVTDDKPNFDMLQLAHRSLSKLKLQSFALDQMKSMDEIKTLEDYRWVYIAGRVLGECFGPLNYVIMKISKKDRPRYYGVALDSYVRAASLLDSIGGLSDYCLGGDREACLRKADKLIDRCRQLSLCCPDKSCTQIVESAAKSISNIAKRRLAKESTEGSLLAFFASLDIFVAVGDSSLPTRFLEVSSVLQSLSMTREAFGALSYSILYHAMDEELKNHSGTQTIDNDLLLCDDYINGSVPSDAFIRADFLPKELVQSLHRSVRLLVTAIGCSEGSPKACTHRLSSSRSPLVSQIQILSTSGDVELLRHFVKVALTTNSKTSTEASLLFQLSMALEFLQCFGGAMLEAVRKGNNQVPVSDLIDYIKVYMDEIKTLASDAEYAHGDYLASLYIAGAAIVRGLCKYDTNEPGTGSEHTAYFIDQAENELVQSLEGELPPARAARLMICHISVMMLKSNGHQTHDYPPGDSMVAKSDLGNIIIKCTQVVALISDNFEAWNSIDSRKYNNALLLNIFKVLQSYECEGSSVAAAQSMPLLKEAVQIAAGTKLRLESFILPTLILGELHEYATISEAQPDSGVDDASETYIANKIETLFRQIRDKTVGDACSAEGSEDTMGLVMELYSASSTIQSVIMIMSLENLSSFISHISGILANWKGLQIDNVDSSAMQLSILWWTSSCQMALYFGYMRLGNYSNAWQCIRLCCDINKGALRTMRNKTSPIHCITSQWFLPSYLCSIGFKASFTSRFCQSLEYMARVYLNVGDSRKAKQYIIASAESLHLIPKRSSISKTPSLTEITSLMSGNCGTIRHLQVRTTATDIFSLSMPLSKFDEEVSEVLRNLTCQSPTFHSPFLSVDETMINNLKLDWLREAINYILLCKFPTNVQIIG